MSLRPRRVHPLPSRAGNTTLSRRSDQTLYVPQVCRGVACLLVAFFHGASLVEHEYGVKPLLDLTEFGFSGVHLFFVISGLIIFHAHRRDVDHPRSAPRYLKKRFARIYPFYWAVFLVLGGRKVFTHRMEIGDFLTNALFFTSSKPLVVAVSWTLAYEILFYALFLAFLLRRSVGVAVFAAWFGLVGLNHGYRFAEFVGLDLLNVLFGLGLLTSIAATALRDRLDAKRRDRIGITALVAGLVVFLCTARYCLSLPDRDVGIWIWESLPLTLGFGTGAALLLFAMVSDRIEGFLEQRRILLLIGDASYSIYLLHFYFQKRTSNAIRSLGWVPSGEPNQITALLLLAAIMITSVGCGILIHKWVERPLLSQCRRWLGVGASVR